MSRSASTVTMHADGLPPEGIDVTHAISGPVARLRPLLDNLEALCAMKIGVAETFSAACKEAGEKCDMEPSVIAAYVNAKVRDKLEDHQRKTDQMQLLHEDL